MVGVLKRVRNGNCCNVPPRAHQIHTSEEFMWYLEIWSLGAEGCFQVPSDLDGVGVVWESRSRYETAWAAPGHDCLCSYSHGHGAVRPQAHPSVFTYVHGCCSLRAYDSLLESVAHRLMGWVGKTRIVLCVYVSVGSLSPRHWSTLLGVLRSLCTF